MSPVLSRPQGPKAPTRRPRPASTAKPTPVRTGRSRRPRASAPSRGSRRLRRKVLIFTIVALAAGLALVAWGPGVVPLERRSHLAANADQSLKGVRRADMAPGATPGRITENGMAQRAAPEKGTGTRTSAPGALKSPDPAEAKERFPLRAMAFPEFELALFNARVFRGPAVKPVVTGHLRRGTVIPAKPAVAGPGCAGGRWHPITGGGVICTLWGYEVGKRTSTLRGPRQRQPDLSQAIPYRYAKVERQGAPLLRRKPTIKEVLHIEEAEAGRLPWPEIVQRRMKGVFMLAIDRKATIGGRPYYRTVQGQFVAAEDLVFREPPRMRGEHLGASTSLPLAFVHGTSAPVFKRSGKDLIPQPPLEKHTRFTAKADLKLGKQTYVKARDGRLVPREALRLARARAPAKDIPSGAHWVHVDLAEQTLVAYEGRRPVFATLVSSGKKGFVTKPGLFRIESKHLSTTMDGPDPEDGFYRIEEVPWTMYYWRSYAVHGAFWHDDFGTPRSHGCTNVAPEDARWLFHWTKPEIPDRWHARLNTRGTWFYLTR